MADLWRTLDLARDTVVEASAGTGKTYTIERLVGRLILEEKTPIERILLVTFTEKATGEMKERIRIFLRGLLSGSEEAAHPLDDTDRARLAAALQRFDEAAIMTIHGFCQGVLTDFAFENGQVSNQELGTTDELQRSLLRQIMRLEWPCWAADMGRSVPDMIRLEGDAATPTRLYNDTLALLREWAPDTTAFLEAWSEQRQTEGTLPLLVPRTAARLHERLEEEKARRAIFTFNDMVHRVAHALQQQDAATNPLVSVLRNRYDVALVDEFQDTDPDQWSIFRTIFHESPRHRLIVVGDPKQAIYRFRGADLPTYMQAKDLIGNTESLDTNFRSTAPLMDGFNACYAHELWFGDGAGIDYTTVHAGAADALRLAPLASYGAAPIVAVDVCTAADAGKPPVARRMARFTAQEIAACLADPSRLRRADPEHPALSPNDFSILVRTRADAIPFERALRGQGIRYSFYKKAGVYQSDEALHLQAVLEMLANPGNEAACRQALVSRVFDASAAEAAAHELAGDVAFRGWLERWLEACHSRQWPKLFHSVLYETGLLFREIRMADGERRVANYLQITEELEALAFDRGLDINGLSALLLQHVRDVIEIDEEADRLRLETEHPAVKIMTMHVCKGLQFPVVFIGSTSRSQVGTHTNVFTYTEDGKRIVSLDKGAKPKMLDEESAEQKRLYYVAMTRAKYRVFMPAGTYLTRGDEQPIDRLTSPVLHDLASTQPTLICRTPYDSGQPPPAEPEPVQPARTKSPHTATDLPFHPHLPDPAIRSRKRHVDSFSRLARHRHASASTADDTAARARDKADGLATAEQTTPEMRETTPRAASLIPRGARGGLAFHDLMELLSCSLPLGGYSCAAKFRSPQDALASAPFGALVDHALSQHGIPATPTRGGVSASPPYPTAHEELTAIALKTLTLPLPAAEGGATFRLSDLTPADCRAEMEFYVTEAESMLGADPQVAPERRGLLNGFIDLLFEYGGRYYILDWKTNTLEDYTKSRVQRAMEESDYLLQYRIYGLALMRWLEAAGKSPELFGGAFYLFVRGALRPEGVGLHADLWETDKRAEWQQFVSGRLRPRPLLYREPRP